MRFPLVLTTAYATGVTIPCQPGSAFNQLVSTLDMETGVPPIAVLPLPNEQDSLAVLDAKMSSYLYVVHIGTSIDAATGSVVGQSEIETPENQAVQGMKPRERDYYDASIDWNTDRNHTPTSQRPLKKALRRAEALNRIYSTNKAEPCHYTYFVEHHVLWLPLVTAVARIIGAEISFKLEVGILKLYKRSYRLHCESYVDRMTVIARLGYEKRFGSST